MVLLQLKDPLNLFAKNREFLPGSGFLSLFLYDLAVERDEKSIPSFNQLILLFLASVLYVYNIQKLCCRNEPQYIN